MKAAGVFAPPWSSKREKREFVLMSFSSLPPNIVGSMGYVVISLYAYSLLPSYTYFGMVVAIPILVSVVMNFVWGALSDMWGFRIKLIILGGVITASLYPCMWLPDPALFLALRMAQTVFSSSGSLMSSVATEHLPLHKSRALGDLSLASSVGAIFGGFTVGLFIPKDMISAGSSIILYFFIASMLMQLLSLIPLRFIEEETFAKKDTKAKLSLQVENPRKVYHLMAVMGFAVFGTVVAGSIMPVYLGNVLNHSTTEVGIVASTASIGGLVAAPISGYVAERFDRKRTILVAIIAYLVIWGLWSLTTNIIVLALLWSIPVFSFLFIPSCSLVSEWTSKGSRGKGLGLLSSAVGASQFIAALAGGILIQSLGGGFDAFVFAFRLSLIFIGVGLVLALMLPGEDKGERHED